MKVGFVNIFGKPNAGKSTLLNAIMGEKMAIVSSKVQTTRHRIKAFSKVLLPALGFPNRFTNPTFIIAHSTQSY